MAIKIQGTEWSCSNQCGSNCCSEIFLPLPPAYKKMFEEQGFWIANNNYTDYEWLKFHKAIILEKMNNGDRKISLAKGVTYKLIFNPFKGYDEILINDKCDKLLPNQKCKIFRARPQICRKAKCVVFEKNPEIRWYGQNGLLKDVSNENK